MTKPDMILVRETLLTMQEELEELYREKEWYVSDLDDMLVSAIQIMNDELLTQYGVRANNANNESDD